MMDEFIHWPKPYLLLSTTYDEVLSKMLGTWMKSHLVIKWQQLQHCKSIIPHVKIYKERQIMLG